MKKIVAIMLVLLILLPVAACSSQSGSLFSLPTESSPIVGTWLSNDDFNAEMTFYGNGTFNANLNPGSGTYSISDYQLMLSAGRGTAVLEYSINGNILTLTVQGHTVTLSRK